MSCPLHAGVAAAGGPLGTRVRGPDGVVPVEVGHLVGARAAAACVGDRPIGNASATPSSWRTWPKVNARRSVPNVLGARKSADSRLMLPWRSRSLSSIQSAPATSAHIYSYPFPALGRPCE